MCISLRPPSAQIIQCSVSCFQKKEHFNLIIHVNWKFAKDLGPVTGRNIWPGREKYSDKNYQRLGLTLFSKTAWSWFEHLHYKNYWLEIRQRFGAGDIWPWIKKYFDRNYQKLGLHLCWGKQLGVNLNIFLKGFHVCQWLPEDFLHLFCKNLVVPGSPQFGKPVTQTL